MKTILLLVRIALAAIFALAAVGKFLDLKGSKKAVQDFGVPENLAKPLAVILPVTEMLIAIILLFASISWFGAIGAALLLLIFIGGMGYQMWKGNAPDCHCFGAIHSEPVSPKSLIRNAVFLLLALILIISGKENQGLSLFASTNNSEGVSSMQYILGLAVVGLLGGIVYLLKQISDQQLQILRRIEILELTSYEGGGGKPIERENVAQPSKGLLIGSNSPDFELPDLNGKNVSLNNLLARQKPLLLFFVSPTCNPCGALLPEIEKWQNELKDQVSFVFISNGKAKENAEKLGGTTLKQVLLQKNREVAEMFGAQWTPTVLFINAEGKIASQAAAGDAAIRALIEKIKAEKAENKKLLIAGTDNKSLGSQVPEFSLEDLSGKPIKSEDLRGRKTLIAYWSVSCGYCTQMLDELRDWDKTKGQDQPNLLLISSGDVEKNRELNFESPVILDDKRKVAPELGMNGTPSAVLIDEEGKVVSEVAVGAKEIWTLISKRK